MICIILNLLIVFLVLYLSLWREHVSNKNMCNETIPLLAEWLKGSAVLMRAVYSVQ
jgi:hypothetical protein